ncbi:MAG: helix-turn-helix domain-containing protein [Chthoniobacterales bacterium]
MGEALEKIGWEISPSGLTRIENGERNLMDLEILEILKVLGKSWSALETPMTSPLKDSGKLDLGDQKKAKRK